MRSNNEKPQECRYTHQHCQHASIMGDCLANPEKCKDKIEMDKAFAAKIKTVSVSAAAMPTRKGRIK